MNKTKIEKVIKKYIKNLEPSLEANIINIVLSENLSTDNQICAFIRNKLGLLNFFKNSAYIDYWIKRGWPENVAYFKAKEFYKKTQRKRLSPFSVEFWENKGFSKEEATFERNSRRNINKEFWIKKGHPELDAIQLAKEQKKSNNLKGSNSNAKNYKIYTNQKNVLFWTSNGHTEQFAKKQISLSQSTFSKEKCISKHGTEKGLEIWLKRQEKWAKNYKKSNYSKVSQKLFWSVYNLLENKSNIHFAELGEKDTNNEIVLKLKNRTIKPDFINMSTKKIIEFDGAYWHDVQQNPYREHERDKALVDYGYEILHIKEYDYYENKEECIKKCLMFLKQP